MLSEADVRGVIGLIAEVSIFKGDLSHKRQYLLGRLCNLIDGDTWSWTLSTQCGGARKGTELLSVTGNRGDANLSQDNTGMCSRVALALKGANDLSNAFLDKESLLDLSTRNNSSRRVKSNLTTLVIHQISDEVVSTISIARRAGRIPFSRREGKIAQIILSEITWLHEQHETSRAKPMGINLSPRRRAAFVHLLDGLDRRTIAQRLSLSTHTVNGYIKDIYRHHGVNSRAELMKQFSLGAQRGA